jgi:hypothetical protein
MSDTPRTDDEADYWQDAGRELVNAEFARKLERELNDLARWKREQLQVSAWWSEIDKFIRDQPDAPLGYSVSAIALQWLTERDRLKRENAQMREALKEAHSFINDVGTEDPEDIETMAIIEQLSGRITAALGDSKS